MLTGWVRVGGWANLGGWKGSGEPLCGEQDSTVTNPLPDRPTHLFRALPVVSASFLFGHLKSKYRPNNNSSPWLSLLCLIQPNLSWTLICQLNYAVFKTDPTRLYKSFASRLYNSFAIL